MYVMYLMAGLYVLYVYYLAVMHLKHLIHDGKATRPMRIIGYWLILPPALLCDWLVNIMLTVPFMDLPRSPWELVTGRLKRYTYENHGAWRRKVALWFATILDAADPSGKHI